MIMISMALQEAAEPAASGGLFTINGGLMIWTIVIFLALVVVLGRYAWGPILGALEARERRIREILEAAAADREEAARVLADHRRQLAESRQQVQQLIAEGRQDAERVRQEMLEQARRQQEEMLERARQDIERERERAIDDLRREAVELSLAAASRLIEKRLGSEDDRRIVEEYLSRVEAADGAGAS